MSFLSGAIKALGAAKSAKAGAKAGVAGALGGAAAGGAGKIAAGVAGGASSAAKTMFKSRRGRDVINAAVKKRWGKRGEGGSADVGNLKAMDNVKKSSIPQYGPSGRKRGVE